MPYLKCNNDTLRDVQSFRNERITVFSRNITSDWKAGLAVLFLFLREHQSSKNETHVHNLVISQNVLPWGKKVNEKMRHWVKAFFITRTTGGYIKGMTCTVRSQHFLQLFGASAWKRQLSLFCFSRFSQKTLKDSIKTIICNALRWYSCKISQISSPGMK